MHPAAVAAAAVCWVCRSARWLALVCVPFWGYPLTADQLRTVNT